MNYPLKCPIKVITSIIIYTETDRIATQTNHDHRRLCEEEASTELEEQSRDDN